MTLYAGARSKGAQGRTETAGRDPLGDWIKAQRSASRVVVVSGKDRASITMAGHRADAVFWYADGARHYLSGANFR
jgi:hypothetical protein